MFKKSLRKQNIERRLSARERLQAMVNVVRGENQAREKIINYSLTGLFLKCNLPDQYNINDEVQVSFKDNMGACQTHSGQVIRKSPEGIAVHYQKKN